MKPKIVFGSLLLLIFIVLPSITTVEAVYSYTKQLPTNTLFFDDFERSSLGENFELLSGTGTVAIVSGGNQMPVWQGDKALEVNTTVTANAGTQVIIRQAWPYGLSKIGISFDWVAKGDGGTGQAWKAFQVESDIQYLEQWRAGPGFVYTWRTGGSDVKTWKGNTGGSLVSPTYTTLGLERRPQNDQGKYNWSHVKLTWDLLGKHYDSLISDNHLYNFIGNSTMNFGTPDTVDPNLDNMLNLIFEIDTDNAGVASHLWLDNVLITDETPGLIGSPIAFAILNSAWILATLIPVAGLVTWTGVNRTETGREWTPKQKFMAVFGVTLMVTVLAVLGIVLLSLRA